MEISSFFSSLLGAGIAIVSNRFSQNYSSEQKTKAECLFFIKEVRDNIKLLLYKERHAFEIGIIKEQEMMSQAEWDKEDYPTPFDVIPINMNDFIYSNLHYDLAKIKYNAEIFLGKKYRDISEVCCDLAFSLREDYIQLFELRNDDITDMVKEKLVQLDNRLMQFEDELQMTSARKLQGTMRFVFQKLKSLLIRLFGLIH